MFAKILLFKLFLTIAFVNCEFYKECQDTEVGTFVARLKNCTQYIYCNDMDSLIGDCPAGHYFDSIQSLCAENDGVACKVLLGREDEQPSTTAKPATISPNNNTNSFEATTTTTTAATITQTTASTTTVHIITQELTDMLKPINALGRPSCQPTFEQTFAHPQRCEYYYKCTRGFLTILRCSFLNGWDHERQLCVPLSEAKCVNAV